MAQFTDEHLAFRDVVRDFARRELAPHVDEWESAAELPLRAVASMAELGLFGIVFAQEWGGSDGDFTSLCIAIEEIGVVSQSLGITLSAAVGLGANPIHSFGTDEQKAMWLPDLVAGRRLGAFGLTEPDGGSDAGATRTRAVMDGDEWVLD
ncbi:MAG: acyl-CoA dehydrogenase family protein, partial [Ilumatobacteraceae bacterium]